MSYQDFCRGIPAAELKRRQAQQAAHDRERDMRSRWVESERILSILRSVQPVSESISGSAVERWYHEASSYPSPFNLDTSFSEYLPSPRIDTPSEWFHSRFPRQVQTFGQAFVEELGDDGAPSPILVNTDTIAACLCGEKALGHQIVFYPCENQWYFYDPYKQAFCQTTSQKVQLLASNYLVQCAQAFRSKNTILPLMTEFRQPGTLQLIVSKAKSIQEADRRFFEGPDGKIRFIDGHRLDPATEPPHRTFVREAIVKVPGTTLTMGDAFRHYNEFCRTRHLPRLKMVEFKNEASAEIHEKLNIRLRHDITGEDGRANHGWRDLTCICT